MAEIIILIGAASALLLLIDIILDEKQKQSLQLAAMELWSALDAAKDARVGDWVRRRSVMLWLISFGFFSVAASYFWEFTGTLGNWPLTISSPLFFTIGGAIGTLMLYHALSLRSATLSPLIITLYAFFVLVLFITLGARSAFFLIGMEEYPRGTSEVDPLEILKYNALFCIPLSTLLFLLVAGLPSILIRLAAASLLITELVLRRLLESDRRVLVSLSFVLMSIGSVLKVWT